MIEAITLEIAEEADIVLDRTRNVQAILLVTALLILTLSTAAPAQTKLVAWVPSVLFSDGLEAMIPGFQAKYPDIDVEIQVIAGGAVAYMEKLAVATASGVPPDVAWVESTEVKELASRDQVVDLTSALEQIHFTPAEAQEVSFRGKMWAAPYHTTARGLFKNVDHLQAAGINPSSDPQDLEELAVWSQKLTRQNSDGGYSRIGFIPWRSNWGAPGWIWTFGGRLVDETGIRPTANEPKNVQAMEWILEWATRHGNNPNPVPYGVGGLTGGTVSMSAESASSVSRLLEDGVNFTVGPVPHPSGGRNGTWAGGDSFAVPAGGSHIVEAIQFLQHISSAEAQVERFRKVSGVLPSNWESLEMIVDDLPAQYAPLLAQLPDANPRTPLWLEYYVNQLRPQVLAVIQGERSPKEALDLVQQHMEVRFAEVFGAN